MTPANPIGTPRIDWIPLALLAAVALAALAMIGNPSTWVTLTIAGLAMGLLIFIMASGLTLVFGLMDVMNFAHGLFIAIAALLHLVAVGVEDAVVDDGAVAPRLLEHQRLVEADAGVPVGEGAQRFRRGRAAGRCVEDDEVVAQAVHLGEGELHAGPWGLRVQVATPGCRRSRRRACRSRRAARCCRGCRRR